MATYLGKVKLGGLYRNGTVQVVPTKPWYGNVATDGGGVGNIYRLESNDAITNWTIGNTPTAEVNKLIWHKIKDGSKTLLICDRNLITFVSWDALNDDGRIYGKTIAIDGKQYKLRVLTGGTQGRTTPNQMNDFTGGSPTNNEWDRLVRNEERIAEIPVGSSADFNTTSWAGKFTGASNQFWNWCAISSWVQEKSPIISGDTANYGITRGSGALSLLFLQARHSVGGGSWRPVLEEMNVAPSTPSSITVPSTVNGGQSLTVSWGSSTDADGNLSGYRLQRSVNSGGYAQVYSGSSRSYTDSITYGWETVQYRVLAYDSAGATSGYRTSEQRAVNNNSAPTTPASLSLPERLRGGHPAALTWEASTDVDGNLAGYQLERSVDGGGFIQLYQGPERAYTDTLTRGWDKVRYRVRAYDSENARSGYRDSGELPVQNNLPPVIQGGETQLGERTEAFSITYTVSDPEGDGITVTERLDGAVQRSFQAQPDTEYTLALSPEGFLGLLNGDHTLQVEATDDYTGGALAATWEWRFTKAVHRLTVTLSQPLPADAMPARGIVNVSRVLPFGAGFTVEACNNGFDESPSWEDITSQVEKGRKFFFANQSKTADSWGVNLRVTVERNGTVGDCYITGLGGNFE